MCVKWSGFQRKTAVFSQKKAEKIKVDWGKIAPLSHRKKSIYLTLLSFFWRSEFLAKILGFIDASQNWRWPWKKPVWKPLKGMFCSTMRREKISYWQRSQIWHSDKSQTLFLSRSEHIALFSPGGKSKDGDLLMCKIWLSPVLKRAKIFFFGVKSGNSALQ